MHECWGIAEIRDLIFSDVFSAVSIRDARCDLVKLAMTCKLFSTTALDMLWRKQSTLFPLIKLLPRELWKETEDARRELYLTDARPFRPSDFVSFDFYAGKIQFLEYRPSGNYSPPEEDLQIFHELWSFRGQQLLPNLRCLRLIHLGTYYQLHGFDILMGPSLAQVELEMEWDANLKNVDDLIVSLEKSSVPLEHLDLAHAQNLTIVASSQLSSLVQKSSQLRFLSCGKRQLTTEALTSLASFESLYTLCLSNSARDLLVALKALPVDGLLPFPVLRHLELRQSDITDISAVLEHLNLAQLAHLYVEISTDVTPNDLERLFTVLKNRCSSRFSTIRLTPSPQTQPPGLHRSSVASYNTLITPAILRPLLDLDSIICFEMTFPCAFTIDDVFVADMAEAWPKLQILQLGPRSGWAHRTSAITFDGLRSIVENCRDLTRLGLVFHATSQLFVNFDTELANRKIDYLYIGNSTKQGRSVKGDQDIARSLKTLFPKLLGIGGSWLYGVGTINVWEKPISFLQRSNQ
ncbi:hypothetical protein C8J56DRAFT_519006 [Mycena floridula]|nr:hypothetical protein C8J56DRAFT_519006 [Mycena floridula]